MEDPPLHKRTAQGWVPGLTTTLRESNFALLQSWFI
jgi:hypothetical protein